MEVFHEAYDSIATLPRIVMAAINGYALGGGMRVRARRGFPGRRQWARFGLPEILLGLIPAAGATQRLPRLVGPRSGEKDAGLGQMPSEEALRIGLVDRVTEAEGETAISLHHPEDARTTPVRPLRAVQPTGLSQNAPPRQEPWRSDPLHRP